jgi:hypothetical protein
MSTARSDSGGWLPGDRALRKAPLSLDLAFGALVDDHTGAGRRQSAALGRKKLNDDNRGIQRAGARHIVAEET